MADLSPLIGSLGGIVGGLASGLAAAEFQLRRTRRHQVEDGLEAARDSLVYARDAVHDVVGGNAKWTASNRDRIKDDLQDALRSPVECRNATQRALGILETAGCQVPPLQSFRVLP